MKVGSWSPEAVEDLLNIARTDWRTATRVREALRQYLRDETGDVKKLAGRPNEWRPRVGDWRVRFTYLEDGSLSVQRVLNRRDAYD